MQSIDLSFIFLIISTLLVTFLIRYALKSKPYTQIQKLFALMLGSVAIICIGLIVQKLLYIFFKIDPVYIEGFVYIGTCLFPVFFFLMTLSLINTNVKFSKKYILLFIIPVINILLIFTNNYHHLFYKVYSFNLNEMEYGVDAYIHLVYTYVLFFISIVKLLIHTTKSTGFFSMQSLFIITGVSIPVVINILGSFNIIHMNVYTTPISFSLAVFFITLAIFKFNFLSITPIALERIVDRMSDCYIVLNEKNVIVDFNKPFLKVFKVNENAIRNHNLFSIDKSIDHSKLENALQKVSVTSKTISYETYVEKIKKYFNIEISSIVNNNLFLGTLILFKDVTQHENDMKAIKDNQDMLIERERFASLRSNDWWYCSQLKDSYYVYIWCN